MIINSISIRNLLSFESFAWEGLDPHLNIIVGPNGVGKTNIFIALEAVLDALNSNRSGSTIKWANAGYQGTDSASITVTLDIHFNSVWEKRILSSYLSLLLLDQQAIQQVMTTHHHSNLSADGLNRFADEIQKSALLEDLNWLFTGRLVATFSVRGGWRCKYEACQGMPSFRIDLTGGGELIGRAETDSQIPTQNWGSLFTVWRNRLSEYDRIRLDNGLKGVDSESGFPTPDFSNLPAWISSEQGVQMQVKDQMLIVDSSDLATSRSFTSVAQIPLLPGELIGSRYIFNLLFERALVFTANVRQSPQRTFPIAHLFSQPLYLRDGTQLTRFLFGKKNGNLQDREQFTAIQRLFSQMTGGREFDVVFSSDVVGGMHQVDFGNSPDNRFVNVSLDVVIQGTWKEIPLDVSGAGIAEALFLSALIAGSSGQVILLDEPALNMHPTMQTTLLRVFASLSQQSKEEGSQFLINTHNANLVPSDSIECVSRFTSLNGQTVRRTINVRDSRSGTLVDLKKLLRGNLEARNFLFSRAVLLLEGETELGVLSVWCPYLLSQDIAFFVVGGMSSFVSPLKLIHSFGIPWAIIGDGEVLWDLKGKKNSQDPKGQIERILKTTNQNIPKIPIDPGSSIQDFEEWRTKLEDCGIFSLANSAMEGFERAIKPHISSELWKEAENQFSSNKVAFARFIAENSTCPKIVAELIKRVQSYLQLQGVSLNFTNEERLQSTSIHSEE